MTASVKFESEATAEILLYNENEATVNSKLFLNNGRVVHLQSGPKTASSTVSPVCHHAKH